MLLTVNILSSLLSYNHHLFTLLSSILPFTIIRRAYKLLLSSKSSYPAFIIRSFYAIAALFLLTTMPLASSSLNIYLFLRVEYIGSVLPLCLHVFASLILSPGSLYLLLPILTLSSYLLSLCTSISPFLPPLYTFTSSLPFSSSRITDPRLFLPSSGFRSYYHQLFFFLPFLMVFSSS